MIAQLRISAVLRGCSYLLSRRAAGVFVALASSAFLVQPVSGELIYGIASMSPATALVTWDSATPGTLQSGVFLSGLQQNESILGIDFRPATGQLYGLGSSSRLYTINTTTGVASAVGGAFTPALNGFSFGFDFNPTIDRIRVVSEVDQNLVLNPITGAVQAVAPNVSYPGLNPPAGTDPNVVDSAYTNNFPGAASTTLYGIDTGLDILVTQVAATGVLTRVGGLGLDVAAAGGFDISGTTSIAYAAFLPVGSSVSSFYSVNLATGATTNLGVIDGGLAISALTIAPAVPEPATVALVLLGLSGVAGIRRRTR